MINSIWNKGGLTEIKLCKNNKIVYMNNDFWTQSVPLSLLPGWKFWNNSQKLPYIIKVFFATYIEESQNMLKSYKGFERKMLLTPNYVSFHNQLGLISQ